jgi:hypothetical protein
MNNKITYLKNRKCLYCSEPISDQEHGLRKFCLRIKLEDGSVLCCKDDYNAAKRKKKIAPYKLFSSHQRAMHQNIRSLKIRCGDYVSIEQINRYGIIINRPAEIGWTESGRPIYYFIEFALIDFGNQKFKIITHDKLF